VNLILVLEKEAQFVVFLIRGDGTGGELAGDGCDFDYVGVRGESR
jgi:hypothetical protein